MSVIQTGAERPFALKLFPPVYEVDAIYDVKNFQINAIEDLIAARATAYARSSLLVRALHGSEYKPTDPYNCYFEIPDISHNVKQSDPENHHSLLLRDVHFGTLSVGPSSLTEILFRSPFALKGSLFSWETARRTNWHVDAAGIKAEYWDEEGTVRARYSLVYAFNETELWLKPFREMTRHTPHHSPMGIGMHA